MMKDLEGKKSENNLKGQKGTNKNCKNYIFQCGSAC